MITIVTIQARLGEEQRILVLVERMARMLSMNIHNLVLLWYELMSQSLIGLSNQMLDMVKIETVTARFVELSQFSLIMFGYFNSVFPFD